MSQRLKKVLIVALGVLTAIVLGVVLLKIRASILLSEQALNRAKSDLELLRLKRENEVLGAQAQDLKLEEAALLSKIKMGESNLALLHRQAESRRQRIEESLTWDDLDRS